MAELKSILRYEEVFCKQKAKCKWIKEGNGSTRFFHRVASGRKRKNLFTKLLIERTEVRRNCN